RLVKISGLRLAPAFLPLPPLCMLGAVSAARLALRGLRLSARLSLAAGAVFAALVYSLLMLAAAQPRIKRKRRA
ncbi:MAG: hypothetical protein ILP09_00375, partial [Oscillospiraceae bacterium]|nr:hypothetical protein [Oscillospiraceae bacterium]